MFDERVPPPIREILCGVFASRRLVEQTMGMIANATSIPPAFAHIVAMDLARMERAAWEILSLYRRGEIDLDEAMTRLEHEFDVERIEIPEDRCRSGPRIARSS